MSNNFAITKVQISTGEILETKPMDVNDAGRQLTRVEEVMCKSKIDPTLRFPHYTGNRILAANHIVQAWMVITTVQPAQKPDPEA